MLTYSFSNIGSDSLYEHLYKCLKNDILQGLLKVGEKLPSKRSFAKNLGISVITIENAYAQLMSEGYIYSIPKKGFFVEDLQNSRNLQYKNKSIRDIEINLLESAYNIDFSSNTPIKEMFPFTIWAKLLRECLHDYQDGLLENVPCGGLLELRRAIAKHLAQFRGMLVNEGQIIIGTGTEYLYGQIVQLLGQDKIYGVEDPGYQKISKVYKANGVKTRILNLYKDGISISELEEQDVNVVHISPSHQFPTGIITPISKRYEILSWVAKGKDRYIIEDDYDSEFRMIGKSIPSLQSIDSIEKVIYLNTFSKSITPTLRISYMVLPKQLTELYYEKLSFYACPVTTMIQIALARFISEGYFEKHINRMRNFYKKQRDLLVKYITDSNVSKYVTISEEDAGLHFVLHLDINLSDEEFKQKLAIRNVKICALSEYYQNKKNKTEHEFVINYSSLSEGQIKQAVEILEKEIIAIVKR